MVDSMTVEHVSTKTHAKHSGKLTVTVDSGAEESVCGPEDAPEFPAKGSPEQKRWVRATLVLVHRAFRPCSDLHPGRPKVSRQTSCRKGEEAVALPATRV